MIGTLEEAAGTVVSRETFEKLEAFVELLRAENLRQNLISKSTVPDIWQRHIIDSAQLARYAPAGRNWADIGSGAGLPGLVLGILLERPTVLVEPRRLRVNFLEHCVAALGLTNVTIVFGKADKASGSFDAITARAVASVADLLTLTQHLAGPKTRWVLPKGRSGAKELAEAERAWQGCFRAEPSITDPESVIVVAEGVRPRGGTSR